MRHGILSVRPCDAQMRPQPGERRSNQAFADDLAPAPETASRHHLLTRPRHPGPVIRVSDAVADDSDDGLHDRAHRETPTPKLGRLQRSSPTVTKYDAQDGELLEDVARRQIGDALAIPNAVPPGTAPHPALPATQARGLDFLHQVKTPPHRNPVGRQPKREYTLDTSRGSRSGYQPNTVIRVLRCGFACAPRSVAHRATRNGLSYLFNVMRMGGYVAAESDGLHAGV